MQVEGRSRARFFPIVCPRQGGLVQKIFAELTAHGPRLRRLER